MSEVKFDFTDKRFVVTGASSGMLLLLNKYLPVNSSLLKQ